MELMKQPAPLTDEEFIYLKMTPDEYGMMCKFMTENAVGYGPGRTLTNKWRDARDKFRKETK